MKRGIKTVLIVLMAATLTIAAVLLLQPRSSTQPTRETQALLTTMQTEATATQSTQPQPTQEPPPDSPELAQARAILADMTLREKLCQLMILSPDTVTGVSPTREAGEKTKAALEQFPVCGFSFSQENISTRDQTAAMLSGLQEQSELGLFFALDEEGGTVWRVMGNERMGTPRLKSMYSYREQGGMTAYKNAELIAKEMARLGFNLDFAPVADVWSNPANTVIGGRAYSDSFSQAQELVAQAVRGFHAGGVACTLKHFPGHGCTVEDSHKGLATVNRTPDELRQAELLPFAAGLDAGADIVMVGHLLVRSIDPESPATFSYAIVTELLREELGFDGVVMTDALGMGALAQYSEADRCQKALEAGCDILLGVTEPEQTLQALTERVQNGSLQEQRIDESVLRILLLKLARGLLAPQA